MLILFVEYHAAFRQSASYPMNREDDLDVVAQAGTVAEARERMAEGGVEVAIVDIPLPDEGAERWCATSAGPTPPCRSW